MGWREHENVASAAHASGQPLWFPARPGIKSHPKIIDRILEVIREHQTFCIVGHIRPDGDCIGSQLGLASALANEGKKVTVWNQDPIPDKYKFLDRESRWGTVGVSDNIIDASYQALIDSIEYKLHKSEEAEAAKK